MRCNLRCPMWLVLWGMLLLATGVMAQENPPPLPEATNLGSAAVIVEGRRLFEISGEGKLTAAERAGRINRRLRSLITRENAVPPFQPGDIRAQSGQTLVILGNEPILAVTEIDAQDNLMPAADLAARWGTLMANAVRDARAVRESPLGGAGILMRNSARDLLLSIVAWLPRLAGTLAMALLFWLFARTALWLARTIGERTALDPNIRQLVRALAFYGTWAVGFVAILSTLGFQTGGLIAALGVSGFILGFAFKDILSHFLAGLMLLMGRQFRIGDQIAIREHEGTVERIELRALYLRTYDNRLVIIPNAEVFTSVITSNTASPHRRRDFVVGIGYEQDIEKAKNLALETVRQTPGVVETPSPDVLVDELAASTVNLRVRFFSSSLRADYLRVGSDCAQRVKEAFDREGVSMPTDIQTLVVENVEAVAEALREAANPPAPPLPNPE